MGCTSATKMLGDESAPCAEQFVKVRAASVAECASLTAEDMQVQGMADVSPPKWHLAHTTWFFDRMVLANIPGYRPFDPLYDGLFNSYYEAIGRPFSRPKRGLLSRPSLSGVLAYRQHVDAEITARLARDEFTADAMRHLLIGLHHERQHQELLLTDVKFNFFQNPMRPAYLCASQATSGESVGTPESSWRCFPGGLCEVGAGSGFAFDNECPRHQIILRPFALASRPVNNADMLAFIADDGYLRSDLWLADGWMTRQSEGWQCPLYWECRDDVWWTMTLAGMHPVVPGEAACHLSFYEADAVARWRGNRLPTEEEWEVASFGLSGAGNFVESGLLHTTADDRMFGNVWVWTSSSYRPYPGHQPWPAPLTEYNAKFMCNQMVLRGGSCLSSADHIRPTYRNFFPATARWQCTGVRLARDL